MIAKAHNLQNPREKEVAFATVKEYLDKLSPIIRESYISHSATVLGVSVALFGASVKKENINARFSSPKEDIGRLSIIKTLYENRNLIDDIVSVVDSSMFGNYTALFESVIKQQSNNPNLVGLMLDENIKIMQESELKRALGAFLFGYYSNKLKTITGDSSMPLRKKSFLIRKIKMDIMPRLKRGELVAYNSF
jgi:DNA primase